MKHFLRKLIQKTGFDFHKYRPQPDRAKLWRNLNIKTVLDIGANTGQFALSIRTALPEAQIYSFEPLKSCFEDLIASRTEDIKFRAFNCALGDINGEVEMHKSAYSPSSSILEMSQVHKTLFPHTKEHTSEKIKIKRLDEVVKDLNLQKEILIKVDVQGFEDKVLAGGQQTFALAKAVIMELSFVELYKGQALFDTIYENLKSLGFEYKGSLQQKVDKHSGEIISEDSLFIRSNK